MPASVIRRWRCAPFIEGSATSIPSSLRTGADQPSSRSTRLRGGVRLGALEVEQLAVEPVADRPPHVLLDQAPRQLSKRDPFVVVARGLRHAGHDQRRERLGLGRGHLRVADPHLDRAEREVRADRPPHLGVLDDRAGADEEVDVVGERLPAAERIGNAAARKALGEDLRARGVQARVAAVEERRVGRDREQQRQHRAQPIAHEHGPVGAPDADVDVQRERVVAPGHVLEAVLDAVIVLGVDDPLLAVVRPRMRAGGAERDAVVGREREQPPAPVALQGHRGGEVGAAARADLDLGGDQLAGDRVREHGVGLGGVAELLEPRHEAERWPDRAPRTPPRARR